MAVEGSLDVLQIPEILQMVSQQQKTGILTIQGQSDIIAISFLDGRVVAADALSRTSEDALGEVLVEEGLLTREALRSLTVRHSAGEARLAELLVHSGHLNRSQLLEAMRLQVFRLLTSLLGWREGNFKFYGGDEVSYEEGFRPIEVHEILLRAGEEGEQEDGGEAPIGLVGESISDTDALLLRDFPRAQPAPGSSRAPEGGGGVVVPHPAMARSATPAPGAPAEGGADEPPAADRSVADRSAVDRHGVELYLEEEAAGEPETVRRVPSGQPLVLACVALALVLVVWGVVRQPSDLFLPMAWHSNERTALEALRWDSRLERIDQAAKTHFLLEGRFPDRLATLVELGLVAPDELRGPEGGPLSYEPQDLTYSLAAAAASGEAGGAGRREGIIGNFLLDPGFFEAPETRVEVPLVLLD